MRALRSFGAIVIIWTAGRGLLLYATGIEAENAMPFAVAPPPVIPEPSVIAQSDGLAALTPTFQRLPWRSVQTSSKLRQVLQDSVGISAVVFEGEKTVEGVQPLIAEDATQSSPTSASTPFPAPSAMPVPVKSLISGSGYVFIRSSDHSGVVRLGDNLGGSQASLRLTGPELVSVNAWTLQPFARATGALAPADFDETAAGLTLGRRWPLAFLSASVEHRFRTGRNGRTAAAVTLSGGIAKPVPAARLTLSGYGQAGIVGASRRDGFADGEVRIESDPITTTANVRLGVAAWAGIQPGLSRIDVGPSLALPIKTGPAVVTIRADWRFRIAGSAQPGSGPALTLATDF
jgi:hypothetical protein